MTMLERNFDAFGFADALSAARASVDAITGMLGDYATSKIPRATAPLCFDSQNLAVLAYKGAMERVRARFWTTTYLGSGFWSDANGDILDANIRMMSNCRRAGAVVRRLFLLALPPEEEIQRIQDQRILLLKCQDFDGLARFDQRMANLARNITLLLHHGCDVRAVHDSERLHQELPADLNADAHDTELAVYDDWRFDLFRGGLLGTIQSVQCYTPVMPCFSDYRDTLARYFEALWKKSTPIEGFLDRLQKNVEYSSSRIDYPVSWLVHYDHALPREDEALKIEELSSVRVELIRLERWGRIRRFLDVGTCTGRYLFSLRDAVDANGMILGVDNDIDCVRFTQDKVHRELGCEPRFRIERHDFRAPELPSTDTFDLITCMLGTFMHFEHQEADGPPYGDALQCALEKFARLLTEDGLLFFTVWTEEACRALRLLSIYSEEDKRRLAKAVISQDELQQRIACAGLRALPPILLQNRLVLYRCARSSVVTPVGL
jgi:SAM-dependent methyltransferase